MRTMIIDAIVMVNYELSDQFKMTKELRVAS